jgi:hydroxyacylglutathione hydrolase
MKRINREGPPLLGGFHRPQRLPETRLAALLAGGALVVDTRHAADFAAGHVPGTLNIPLNAGFTTWAGWLLPYDRDFYLLLDDACTHCLDRAVKDLAMIGLDRLSGYFGAEVLEAWSASGHPLQTVPQITASELAEELRNGTVAVLDVRGAAEWEAGHLPGALNIPAGYLADRLEEVPRERPLVVHCQAGARSAMAASLLQAHGFDNVINLQGGYARWQAGGHAAEHETGASTSVGAPRSPAVRDGSPSR